jgi:DNA mismatch repair protein MutS2
LRKTLAGILKRVSEKEYTQEDIVTQRDGRYVIPVKVENKKNVQGIIHSSSATGATVFIEPTETINLNNELTENDLKSNIVFALTLIYFQKLILYRQKQDIQLK